MNGLRTLKITRPLLNVEGFTAWALGQGFSHIWHAPHITLAYSRALVDWNVVGLPDPSTLVISPSPHRTIERLAGNAVGLMFDDLTLVERHAQIRMAGASWDWPEYRPHITITYEGSGADLTTAEPYGGRMALGAERFAEI